MGLFLENFCLRILTLFIEMLLLFNCMNFMFVLFNLSIGLFTVLYFIGIIAESKSPLREIGYFLDDEDMSSFSVLTSMYELTLDDSTLLLMFLSMPCWRLTDLVCPNYRLRGLNFWNCWYFRLLTFWSFLIKWLLNIKCLLFDFYWSSSFLYILKASKTLFFEELTPNIPI